MKWVFSILLLGILLAASGASAQVEGDRPAPEPAGATPPPPPADTPGAFTPGADGTPAQEESPLPLPLPPPSERRAHDQPGVGADQGGEQGGLLRYFGRPPAQWGAVHPPAPPAFNPFGLSETTGRFGWWGAYFSGSPQKVGEYQDLRPSPFWDLDGILSDRRQTLDFTATGLDNEATAARAYFFRDGLTAEGQFQRFLSRLDNEPLHGGPPTRRNQVVTEDLHVGQDYAIRWEELKGEVEQRVTDNITARLRVWGLRKFGERQANSMAHCFNMNAGQGRADNRCHVVSQRQEIDWLTMEIEPSIEARFKRLNIEYLRTMRSFSQSDQIVTREFNQFPPFGPGQTRVPYAVVPDIALQIDRLKIGADLPGANRLYAYLYNGDTENQNRDTHRRFRGFDVRLTNQWFRNATITAYAKLYDSDNQWPPFLLPGEQTDPSTLLHPVDYTRLWTGVSGRWTPFRGDYSMWRGLNVRASYEYRPILRDFANYPTTLAEDYVKPGTVTNQIVQGPVFVQPTTHRHEFFLGPTMRWSPTVDTFVRYKARFAEFPIFGLNPPGGALNSNLPTQEHNIEVGGSWSPRSNLLLSAQVGIQNTWHESPYTGFTENNYPFVLTAWYAPTPKWSFSGGYAYFSNWIDQDITLGYRGENEPPPAETFRVDYNGRAQALNLGARYLWSDRLQFSGAFIWSEGSNAFSVPTSQTGADWTPMPSFANLGAETSRYLAGFDYLLGPNVTCYFRYNYFDYDGNGLQEYESGTSHFFLGGLSARF